MHSFFSFARHPLRHGAVPAVCCAALMPGLSALAADRWADISSALMERLTNNGAKPAWPGGCSGVVVNRTNGDMAIKLIGLGLWRSSDKGQSWQRIDDSISGRDETGWAKDGVFVTRNAGETWKQVAGLKPKEAGFVFTPNWFGCYALGSGEQHPLRVSHGESRVQAGALKGAAPVLRHPNHLTKT